MDYIFWGRLAFRFRTPDSSPIYLNSLVIHYVLSSVDSVYTLRMDKYHQHRVTYMYAHTSVALRYMFLLSIISSNLK